jgi:non-specific serine/threonine protein kinase/serine/threonine-protein kinase
MSPEQADLESDDLDTRSDVYTLGVILYELLVGKTPHDAASLRGLGLEALLRTIREGSFPTPSSRLSTLGDEAIEIASQRGSDPERLRRGIAGELDWIVMRATDRNRERRYGSPRELADDVRRCLENRPIVAGPPGAIYRIRKFVRRHRVGVAVAAAIVLALLVGTVGLAIGLNRALAAEQRARAAESRAKEEAASATAATDFLVGLFHEIEPDDRPIHELTALEALDRGADRIRGRYEERPLLRAAILSALGGAYEQLALYDRAMPLLEESLELRDQHMDPRHPELSMAHFLMGVVLAEQSRYREAVPYYERAIELCEASDWDKQGAIVSPLRSLGNAHRILGDLESAETVLRRAVEIAQDHPGEDSPLYAMTLDNLASTLLTQHRLDEAEETYLQALAIHRARNPKGWEVAQTLLNMTNIYLMRQDHSGATGSIGEAVEIYEHVFGEEHVDAAFARTMQASVLADAGRRAEAITLLQRDLQIFERALGPKHGRAIGTRLDLVEYLRQEERYDEALALIEHQLELLGGDTDSPHLAGSYNQLGMIRGSMEMHAAALAAFERAGELVEQRKGPEHPETARLLALQGWRLRDLGRREEAYARLRRSLEILRAADPSVPMNRVYLCDAVDGLARLHADDGEHETAIPMFEEAVSIIAGIYGEDDSDLPRILRPMAESLRAVGREDDATAAEARAARIDALSAGE